MDDHTPPTSLDDIPGFASLDLESREQLRAMRENRLQRALPPELVQAGLRSTARLLMEQQQAATPRMEHDHVRRFIEANNGAAISRRARAVPRNESRRRSVESMHERLANLILAARTANRRHEMLRVRREMLGLDQGYIRRTLGQEGDRLCGEMNAWLVEAATRLKR
jgi:hypothetical protein